MLGREVASPHDCQVGMAVLQGATHRDRLLQLGAGHYGDRQQSLPVPFNLYFDRPHGIHLEISVNNSIGKAVFEQGAQSQQRIGKDWLSGRGAARVKQNDLHLASGLLGRRPRLTLYTVINSPTRSFSATAS